MKPIQLDFKPTIIGGLLFTSMSVGAMSIVILLTLPWQLKYSLCTVITLSTLYTVLHHCLLVLPWSCLSLNIDIKNQLQLVRKDGKRLEVKVQESTVVTPYLTVLNTKQKNDGQTEAMPFVRRLLMQFVNPGAVVIFNDAVDANAFRQLRVYLRWSKR